MSNSAPGPIRKADDPVTLTIDGAVAAPSTLARPIGSIASAIDAAAPTGDHGTVASGDGLFLASIPLDVLRAATLDERGRLQIDDSPTKCWLVKDVMRITITNGMAADSLPSEEREKIQ